MTFPVLNKVLPLLAKGNFTFWVLAWGNVLV